MGLVNFVISTIGKCFDAACLMLDVNFLIVHTVVRTLLAVVSFITSLPALLLNLVVEFGNFILVCVMSMAETTSDIAHGSVTMLGSLVLALEGLLESLKMVGYLFMHVLLRGKEHLCRGLLSLQEGCAIAVSLVVYFTNTVVNFALIATNFALIAMLNLYSAVVSVWLTVLTPLQMVLEPTLTTFTFLHSSLVGTSAFLLPPCKLVFDFLVSLVHMFISIFILNLYGLLLTLTIALTTTAYLNPELSRQAAVRVVDYINSFPAVRRLYMALHRLTFGWQSTAQFIHGSMHHLQRILHHLYVLERGLWQQLSRHSSQLGLALRTQLHRDHRVRGDGDPGEERRDPPDGRAGDGAHQELLDLVLPSSSTDRPLKKQSSTGKDGKSLLTLLNEQEDRKKCVICQDCAKTVVLLPCRHLCLCRDCTNILLRQPIYQQNCPLCRHIILNSMEVYL